MKRILGAIGLALALFLGRLADGAGPPRAVEVGCIRLPVAALERSGDFFEGLLDFRRDGPPHAVGNARTLRLRLGAECLDLLEPPAGTSRPVPADSRSTDRWFQHVAIVVSDMDRAFARLREAGVERVSPEPQRLPDWNPAAGGIRAFYFRDPDRHVLEIIWYPTGKGNPRWQRPAEGRTFLGIDHTAIVVSDTGRSLRFWRDELGLRVAGESLNHGPEQERLNAVAGARLRITGLRAERGPGVEFLEYLAPGDGRPYPSDSRPEDLWQWVTPVAVTGAARPAGLTRDPDGHAVLITPP